VPAKNRGVAVRGAGDDGEGMWSGRGGGEESGCVLYGKGGGVKRGRGHRRVSKGRLQGNRRKKKRGDEKERVGEG